MGKRKMGVDRNTRHWQPTSSKASTSLTQLGSATSLNPSYKPSDSGIGSITRNRKSMRRPLLTSTRDSSIFRKRPGRRYPRDMKRMNASPVSPSATAMVSTDLSNGSSCWTTARSPGSPKATDLGVPLTFSISMLNPQYEANRSRPSRPGSKNASSGQCHSTKNCMKRPASSTTGGLWLTSLDFATSTRWNKRRQQRYISGRHVWPRTLSHAVPPATDWKERRRHTSSLTSRTWDPFGSAGSSRDAVGFLLQHVDMLM